MTLFQELILISLGKREQFSRRLTDKDWASVYTEAQRQSLVGILLTGVEKVVASGESRPKFLMQWIAMGLALEKRNRLFLLLISPDSLLLVQPVCAPASSGLMV